MTDKIIRPNAEPDLRPDKKLNSEPDLRPDKKSNAEPDIRPDKKPNAEPNSMAGTGQDIRPGTDRDLTVISETVERLWPELILANDRIHDLAELAYEETGSMKVLTELLEGEGFSIETGLAQMPTCFTASWGEGKPVIGILGEFDALDKLSQEGGNPKKTPLKEGAPGHGCGHCTLGVGSAGGAIALKTIMAEEGLPGTVIYFGCPAEEGAGAKQFMARAGMFDEVDFVYTWHPSTLNTVKNASSNAIMGANFSFTGKTAHAGACPWEGRSALDAVELMNVGTNYLHEHMRDGERIHYAYADAGGTAPNVVPDYARIKYEVRAPRVDHMLRLFERVENVAKGAAMMTETKMTCEITMAFCDSLNNSVLARNASDCLQEIGAPAWDEEDYILAKAFLNSYDEENLLGIREELARQFGPDNLEAILEKPLHSEVLPYDPFHLVYEGGSTDVGDVTYTVPACELNVACACLGNIGHTWQMAGQSGSRLAHKGLKTAAKAIALSCIRMMQQPGLIEAAKSETLLRNGGKYNCPLPDEVMPPVGRY